MGLAVTLARRSLLQRPGRTLFSVLGIGVGIATVVGVFTLDHNTVAGLKVRHPDWRPEVIVRGSEGAEAREELFLADDLDAGALVAQRVRAAQRMGQAPVLPEGRAALADDQERGALAGERDHASAGGLNAHEGVVARHRGQLAGQRELDAREVCARDVTARSVLNRVPRVHD